MIMTFVVLDRKSIPDHGALSTPNLVTLSFPTYCDIHRNQLHSSPLSRIEKDVEIAANGFGHTSHCRDLFNIQVCKCSTHYCKMADIVKKICPLTSSSLTVSENVSNNHNYIALSFPAK